MKKIISFMIVIVVCISSVTAMPAKAVANETVFTLRENEKTSLIFNIEENAGYSVDVTYTALKGRNVSPQVAVSWDEPYIGNEDQVYDLTRTWVDTRERERFKTDDYGNELCPTVTEAEKENTVVIMPQDENWHTGFLLTEGKHTLNLQMLQEGVKIKSIVVNKVVEKATYSEYVKNIEKSRFATDSDAKTIYIEAELLHEKSHLEVAVNYDRSSPNVHPNDPSLIYYNILGGSSWSHVGQWVSYNVNVEKSGLYKLNLSYRQRAIAGIDVRRRITVDGKVPFDEFDCLVIPASNDFKSFVPGDENGDYYIYLSEGEHEIRFEVVLGSLQNVINKFKTTLEKLNELSSKINVIVGDGVDLNRDYDFKSSLPEMVPTLTEASETLNEIIDEVNADSKNSGSQSARIEEAARLLLKMAEKPNDIAKQIDYFRSQLYDLASVLSAMQTQPLEIDYFELIPEKSETSVKKFNFFSVLGFRTKAFLRSFVSDYSSMNNINTDEALNVWISLGRDQAQVMNQLITDNFTSTTGVPVILSLVTTNIMTAIASGKAPDVVLNLPSTNIADLYYRDALVDISEMDNIDSVLERFYPSSMISFTYNGAVYALPQTQSFQMIFYRTDVFKANGYKVPNTWEELYALLAKMQNNGMQMGISISEETFYSLLLQSGVSMYNEELSATNLTDSKAVEAFKNWTELFTKYGIPKSYDATNRFRTGQMPFVISDYSFYKTLKVSAPEIQNSFAMAPIPGTVTESGLNRSVNSTVTGAVIIKHESDNYETAMKFIDWVTSDDTQEKYAFNSEIRVGISARLNTANKKVMETISWSAGELDALETQWSQVTQIKLSPAYYYISRNLNNAFRRVVYQYENPSDVIYRYSREINSELERKYSQLRLGEKHQ